MGLLGNARNCWDIISCSDSIRLYCPVYKNKDGKGCYNYSHVILYSSEKSELTNDLPDCMDCPWHKELLSH